MYNLIPYQSWNSNIIASISGDGTKTFRNIMDELVTSSDLGNIDATKLQLRVIVGKAVYMNLPRSSTANAYIFSSLYSRNNAVTLTSYEFAITNLTTSNAIDNSIAVPAGTITQTDMTSSVFPSNGRMEIIQIWFMSWNSNMTTYSAITAKLNGFYFSEYQLSGIDSTVIRIFRMGCLRYAALSGHLGGDCTLNPIDYPALQSIIEPILYGYNSTWQYGSIQIKYSTHKLSVCKADDTVLDGSYVRGVLVYNADSNSWYSKIDSLVIETKSLSEQTISAGDNIQFIIDIAKQNYIPIGITGMSLEGNYYTEMRVVRWHILDSPYRTTVQIVGDGNGWSSTNLVIKVDILYIQQ